MIVVLVNVTINSLLFWDRFFKLVNKLEAYFDIIWWIIIDVIVWIMAFNILKKASVEHTQP